MKNWYLIKTKPRQEKRAKQNLENQGYVTFCPITKINNKLAVLFPGYLFVQLNEKTQNWSPINSTKGVSCFVKFNLNELWNFHLNFKFPFLVEIVCFYQIVLILKSFQQYQLTCQRLGF